MHSQTKLADRYHYSTVLRFPQKKHGIPSTFTTSRQYYPSLDPKKSQLAPSLVATCKVMLKDE